MLPGFLVFQPPTEKGNTDMSKKPTLAVRITDNPFHHLWNNSGTWWCHYTEHLPDYTKRRVRRNLHTKDSGIARVLRDSILFEANVFEEEESLLAAA